MESCLFIRYINGHYVFVSAPKLKRKGTGIDPETVIDMLKCRTFSRSNPVAVQPVRSVRSLSIQFCLIVPALTCPIFSLTCSYAQMFSLHIRSPLSLLKISPMYVASLFLIPRVLFFVRLWFFLIFLLWLFLLSC